MAIIVRTKAKKRLLANRLELKDALEAQKLFAVGPGGTVKAPSQPNWQDQIAESIESDWSRLSRSLERVNHDPPLTPTQIHTSTLGAPTPRVPRKHHLFDLRSCAP
jgi:hypothetical protein